MPDTTIVAADDDDPERVPELPGYQVLEMVGQGGLAVVHRAHQCSLHRDVAIRSIRVKMPDDSAAEMLLREAEILARLQHPCVVSIIDCLRVKGRVYLVLEYAAGGSLAERLSLLRQQPVLAAGIVERLARTVDFVHRRGMTHCNLKPQNVLFTTAPRAIGAGTPDAVWMDCEDVFGLPLISSFGLALDDQRRATQKDGQVFGTPTYMAPEQAAGHCSDIGPTTDVYALGAILYAMLTGTPPFTSRARDIGSLLVDIVEKRPDPVSRQNPLVDGRLDGICLKCLGKRPETRYPSALELARDLRDYLHQFNRER